MTKETKQYKRIKPRKYAIQERSKLTVESILEAAIQVFEQHGYAKGTTARIAERAGVSVGSVYQYFPNKDSIVVALAEKHLNECGMMASQVFANALILPLQEVLRTWVRGCIALHVQHPKLHHLFFKDVVLPGELSDAFRTMEQTIVRDLADLFARNAGDDRAHWQVAAYVSIQMVESLIHALVLHPTYRYSQEMCEEETLRAVLGYLHSLHVPNNPNGILSPVNMV
jgi:AcrR family transcriptional regulator